MTSKNPRRNNGETRMKKTKISNAVAQPAEKNTEQTEAPYKLLEG